MMKCFQQSLLLVSALIGCANLANAASLSATPFYSDFKASIQGVYAHELQLSEDHVAIFWKIVKDDESSAPTLHLAVAAGASGWVGFGISDAGAMPGADIVTFEAASTDTLIDSYSLAFEKPTPDDCESDWMLDNSVTEDGFIAFEVRCLLDTGDPQDRVLLDDLDLVVPATPIITAWGDEEVLSYHGPNNRVRSSVRFFSNGAEATRDNIEILRDTVADGSFTITADNYTIPLAETTYYEFCVDLEDAPSVLVTTRFIWCL
jgi:hypothetical protein